MPYIYIPAYMPIEQRLERAAHWLPYTFKIYQALRRAGTEKSRRETWKLASGIFHCWVWGMAELPFAHGTEDRKS